MRDACVHAHHAVRLHRSGCCMLRMVVGVGAKLANVQMYYYYTSVSLCHSDTVDQHVYHRVLVRATGTRRNVTSGVVRAQRSGADFQGHQAKCNELLSTVLLYDCPGQEERLLIVTSNDHHHFDVAGCNNNKRVWESIAYRCRKMSLLLTVVFVIFKKGSGIIVNEVVPIPK